MTGARQTSSRGWGGGVATLPAGDAPRWGGLGVAVGPATWRGAAAGVLPFHASAFAPGRCRSAVAARVGRILPAGVPLAGRPADPGTVRTRLPDGAGHDRRGGCRPGGPPGGCRPAPASGDTRALSDREPVGSRSGAMCRRAGPISVPARGGRSPVRGVRPAVVLGAPAPRGDRKEIAPRVTSRGQEGMPLRQAMPLRRARPLRRRDGAARSAGKRPLVNRRPAATAGVRSVGWRRGVASRGSPSGKDPGTSAASGWNVDGNLRDGLSRRRDRPGDTGCRRCRAPKPGWPPRLALVIRGRVEPPVPRCTAGRALPELPRASSPREPTPPSWGRVGCAVRRLSLDRALGDAWMSTGMRSRSR